MGIFFYVMDAMLAAFVVWEVVRFVPRYKQLKQAIADRDTQARSRVYYEALAFEWGSALLALAGIAFDWSKLNPRGLGLEGSMLMAGGSESAAFSGGALGGVVVGLILGTVVFVVARLRGNRRGAAPAPNAPAPWWRKLVPDFSALIPTTMRGRMIWILLAISAGVCEEVVFRGWLLKTLHGFGLGGATLILAGAALFGLAHAYQGITGMVVTGLAGAFFCAVYVRTGSLLVPILLHILVDVRFAFLPRPREEARRAYA